MYSIKNHLVPDGVTPQQYSRTLRSSLCALSFIIDSARHAVELPPSDLKAMREAYLENIDGGLEEENFVEGFDIITWALEQQFRASMERYEEARV